MHSFGDPCLFRTCDYSLRDRLNVRYSLYNNNNNNNNNLCFLANQNWRHSDIFVHDFRWRILQEWRQVYIHAPLTKFAFLQLLQPFKVTQLYHLAVISLLLTNCVMFWGERPPRSQHFEKTRAKRALASVKARLLSWCAWKSVHGHGLYAWLWIKQMKKTNERTGPPKFDHYVGAPPLVWSQPSSSGLVNRGTLSLMPNLKSNDS